MQAADILAIAMQAALEPAERKVLRRWSLKEVAELLEVSRRTLERKILEGKLPQGETLNTRRRVFTLTEIHRIREVLNLRPWRNPATDKPIVISVANFKGGVGKTSTAIHMGQYFTLRGNCAPRYTNVTRAPARNSCSAASTAEFRPPITTTSCPYDLCASSK